MNDLSVVYYSANVAPVNFMLAVQAQITKCTSYYRIPIISVTKLSTTFGDNIVVDLPRSHISIYRQALIGAKAATSRNIALCEDDVLYSPEHFKYRPKNAPFAYNIGTWSIFTWQEAPMFSAKGGGRINLCNLVCDRQEFIDAMEERFAKYPDDSQINLGKWAEPGKYEGHLGVTQREVETFYTNPPNVMFFHETALSFENLGERKRLGEMRATEIPYWGTAKQIRDLYEICP